MANGPIQRSAYVDFLIGLVKPSRSKPKKKKKPATVKRYDAKGRTVGVGGHERDKKIMDAVERAQSGKKKKKK